MRTTACLIAALVPLAACDNGPKVSMKNASGNQVAQAVQRSGVMSDNDFMKPGAWESKATVQQIVIPGMPAEFGDKMKQMFAQHQANATRRCLTAAEMRKPNEGFFATEDKSCRYDHFTMGRGKIDIRMICSAAGSTQTTDMTGSYTPQSYAMQLSSKAEGGPQAGMVMKMHVDARRVGECTGKEG
jgi:hypothetical protein